MKIEFPLLTVRRQKNYAFRDRFWKIVQGKSSGLYVVSPFIDSKIFERIFKQAFSGDAVKQLTLITRPPDSAARERDFQKIVKALEHNRSRYRLGSGNSVTWYFDGHLHAKILIADYEKILFGSQNITYNGLGDDLNASKCNNEMGALVTDADASTRSEVQAFVEAIIKGARRAFPPTNAPNGFGHEAT